MIRSPRMGVTYNNSLFVSFGYINLKVTVLYFVLINVSIWSLRSSLPRL